MSKKQRPDGWWYPWIFVGGFVIVIAVNGVMAYVATSTWTGLETKHAFEEGNNYNATLAQRQQQDQLGWMADASYDGNAADGSVVLRITDKNGQGINGLAIDALARRPTSEGHDQVLQFAAVGDGLYRAPANLPLSGQWELRYTATRADDLFKIRQRIRVP
ncbi:MAG: FixH family protein [Alphaproteobacteria bacterium]|nr:FixH family protein [Alphaproteobacteria bacterium]MBF0250425.1 FixH family protein [Alphaproteobacteria bacterium]